MRFASLVLGPDSVSHSRFVQIKGSKGSCCERRIAGSSTAVCWGCGLWFGSSRASMFQVVLDRCTLLDQAEEAP